ncbi:hypothetical protein [Bacillus phage vB_BanS-Thrax4]|nr:hypothetical protein [Bacillus phage vB_BanS-Thrax4]
MKKSLAVLMTMMMAFGMVGCGGVPQNNSNVEQNESDCDLDDLYEGDEDCGFSSKKKKKTSTTNGVVSSPKTRKSKPSTSTSKPNLSKPSTKSSTPKSSTSTPKVNISKPSTPSRSK